MSAAVTATARPLLSTANLVGLAVAGVHGVVELLGVPGGPLSLGSDPKPGENGPPDVVLWFSGGMGLLTLVFAVLAWRFTSRAASRVVAGTRILANMTSWPAFFVGGVPAWLVTVAAAVALLTAAEVYLVLRRPRAT